MSAIVAVGLAYRNKQKIRQIAILATCKGLVILLTYFLLAPAGKSRRADYRFIHCRQCKSEMPYDAKLLDAPCLRCPTRDGTLVATTESIRGKGGAGVDGVPNPWKWFYVALCLEAIVFLGLLTYILNPHNRRVDRSAYLYMNCPKCKSRLRFRESLIGKDGKCPRCNQFWQFPLVGERQEFPEESEVYGF